MKATVKRLIEKSARNPVAWSAYQICGRIGHYLRQIHGHASWSREGMDRDAAVSAVTNELFPDLTVANGPFAGMRYPRSRSFGSALAPKLLGSYESELHPAFFGMLKSDFTAVVDIGCAEGYYAVGLARQLPHAVVYAFDTDERARALCAEMAGLNGVADRVHIGALCDQSALRSIPLGAQALIIADCEGYEATLFDSDMVRLLAPHTVIIEAHDFVDINISPRLRDAFAATHAIRSISSVDDIQKVHRYQFPQLRDLTREKRRLILAERRPATMEWLLMTPLEQERIQKVSA